MLPKKYRLPAKDFRNLYKIGYKIRGKYGMLISTKGNVTSPLFGYVVNKKVGNAVQRHRMTRLLRDITIEAIKEFKLENCKRIFQYVAFEYCDSREDLKIEFFDQLKKVLE